MQPEHRRSKQENKANALSQEILGIGGGGSYLLHPSVVNMLNILYIWLPSTRDHCYQEFTHLDWTDIRCDMQLTKSVPLWKEQNN